MINYQHAEEGQVVPFVHSSLFHTHTARGTMQERRKLETETVVVYIFPFSAINAGNILQLVCTKSIANYTLLVAGNAMPAITSLLSSLLSCFSFQEFHILHYSISNTIVFVWMIIYYLCV